MIFLTFRLRAYLNYWNLLIFFNGLNPTIKFESVYSDSHLNVLALTLHFRDGFISTDVYAKPTDSHLYLPFSSSHSIHCKRAVPFGIALRIKRNCSTELRFSSRVTPNNITSFICSILH